MNKKSRKHTREMSTHADYGDDDDEEKRAKRRSLIAVMKCQVYLFANTLFALTNANKSAFCFTLYTNDRVDMMQNKSIISSSLRVCI